MARLYVDVVGGVVVAKRAAGRNRAGQFPTPSATWVLVSETDYARIRPGWRRLPDGSFVDPEPTGDENDPVRRDTREEHLWRRYMALRMAIAGHEAQLTTLRDRVTTLTAQVMSLHERVTALERG